MVVKNTRILLSVQVLWKIIAIVFYLLYKIDCFRIGDGSCINSYKGYVRKNMFNRVFFVGRQNPI